LGPGCKKSRGPGGHREGVAWLEPISETARTVWRRWDDRAMVEPTESESAFGGGCELEAVAA